MLFGPAHAMATLKPTSRRDHNKRMNLTHSQESYVPYRIEDEQNTRERGQTCIGVTRHPHCSPHAAGRFSLPEQTPATLFQSRIVDALALAYVNLRQQPGALRPSRYYGGPCETARGQHMDEPFRYAFMPQLVGSARMDAAVHDR